MLSDQIDVALEQFLRVWSDGMLLEMLGPQLTCTEANVLADLLTVTGHNESADGLLAAHAATDDEGDSRCDGDPDRIKDLEGEWT